MDDINIIELGKTDERIQTDLIPLVHSMYLEMMDLGLQLRMAEGGAEKWINSIKPGLGRFGVLYVAVREGEVIGFAHGALSSVPDYLGNFKVGVITHIFVTSAFRRSGTALRMVRSLEEWFRMNTVHSIELQVLEFNPGAMAFWEKAGYQPELRQYRKFT